MEMHRPKWAQPLGEPRVCSICAFAEVYYERPEEWGQVFDSVFGPIILSKNMSMKCWCKDCYEDCGGRHVERNG